MAPPELLRALLTAAGPSGHEGEAAAVWRQAAGSFAEVTSDAFGTSFARVRAGADGARTLALVGHVDEIGLTVTHVEEGGLLAFATLGGVGAEALLGQRIDLLTRAGRIPAVVGRRRPSNEEKEPSRLELRDLHLDVGATSREDAERLVRCGDAGVWRGELVELANGRVVSKALDNRLGAYVALEAARRVAEGGRTQVDVVAVASVQEEIGHHGARIAAYGLDPAVALAIDVTWTTDVPGGDPRVAGKIEIGGGPAIAVGATLDRGVSDLLAETAEAEGIAYATEVYTRATWTDADDIRGARAGVPTGLVSIPTRYMHTPNELCALADVEEVVRLVTAFAERLPR